MSIRFGRIGWLLLCLMLPLATPVALASDDVPDVLDTDDLDDELDDHLDDEDDEAEERAEKLLEELLEARFGDDTDLDDLEDELEDWLEQQLERQGDTDDIDDRLERELEKRLQGLQDDDDAADGVLESVDEQFHQLWQLEEDLDDSAFPALPDQAIALLTPEELAAAKAEGLVILQEQALPQLNAVLVTFSGAVGIPFATEPNHLYQLDNDAQATVAATPVRLLALPQRPEQPLPAIRRIGMMDSAIDTSHACLTGIRIQQQLFYPPQAQPDTVHGTAMASVMAGNSGCAAEGLLQDAELVNAVVFARSGNGLVVASAAQLVAGLDWLLQQQAGVINMSLSGPPNRVLEQALNQAAARGVLLVASAGNEGPAAFPRFPAAYPAVMAVTAVDADGQVYARAAQGPHIELAAPGVNVAVAGGDGVQAMSGTSVAAAVVSSLLSAMPEVGRSELAALAQDLGAPGRDPVFGWGLLRWSGKKDVPVME